MNFNDSHSWKYFERGVSNEKLRHGDVNFYSLSPLFGMPSGRAGGRHAVRMTLYFLLFSQPPLHEPDFMGFQSEPLPLS